MTERGATLDRWRSSSFEEELRAWVSEVAGPVVAMQQAKLRPWATVWRVRAKQGVLYAKQNSPGQLFEARLMAELARLAPAYVVPVVAVDRDRGLLLTADQGPVFRDTVRDGDLDAWCRLVQRAMELARLLGDHTPALRAAGATECRVPADCAREVRSLTEDVAGLGLPVSLVHNDLHENNAFDRPEGLVFFDFADSVLGHPLSGLRVPLDVLADSLGGAGPDDPRLRRVADAGLEVWSDLAPAADLRRALPAALRLGCLARAESWARLLPDLSEDALAEWGDGTRQWLDRLLDPSPVRFG